MVIYFSGTGNSRYAAKLIAHELGDELVDAAEYIKGGRSAGLSSQRPWVFVSPTYGWRIPRIYEAFIRDSGFDGSRKAYFVMTCGSEIGNAGAKLEALCKDKSFIYMGVLGVVMPENYVAMFPVPDKAEAEEIIKTALPVFQSAPPIIAAGKHFPPVKINAVDELKTAVVNPGFYTFCVNAKKFRVSDACIGCGKCQRLCPTNTVRMINGRPQWGGGCTHCMACICYCPAKAIEYGKISLGKPRYRCPEYVPKAD